MPRLQESAEAFRVLVIHGPRQAGKSTVLRDLHRRTGGHLLDLDDAAVRAAATDDPESLIRSDHGYVYVDEFQRGGNDLILAVKRAVDRGGPHVILAGSTNFLTTPTLSESLAGRAVIQEIWPFSQGEIAGRKDGLLPLLTEAPEEVRHLQPEPLTREDYLVRIVEGGYPEPLALPSARLRRQWFESYAETVTGRDLALLGAARRPDDLRRLLVHCTALTGQELVHTGMGTALGLDRSTVAHYLSLLETAFLIRPLPVWSRNPTARTSRRPKVHITDTGLASALQHVDARTLASPQAPLRGPLVESFVHAELLRQRTWTDRPVSLSHWRESGGPEVDLVVETPGAGVVGIECKASGSVRAEDFRGLRAFRDRTGDTFRHGVVLYLGEHVLGFGDDLTALPLSALWATT